MSEKEKRREEQREEERCEECGGRIIEEKGKYVCKECGVVKGRVIEEMKIKNEEKEKEITLYAEKERTREQRKVGTEIGYREKKEEWYDYKRKEIENTARRKYRKMKEINKWEKRDKGRRKRIKTIEIAGKMLKLPEYVIERAIFIYQEHMNEEKENIKNRIILAAATLIAVRERGYNSPVTLKEIAEIYNDMGYKVKTSQMVAVAMNMKVKIKHRRSEEYIPRVCEEICSNGKIARRIKEKYTMAPQEYKKRLIYFSQELLKSIPRQKRGGKHPYSFAIAVAYTMDRYIAKEIFKHSAATTLKLIAEATKAGDFCVRIHAQYIRKHYEQDIKTLLQEWKKEREKKVRGLNREKTKE